LQAFADISSSNKNFFERFAGGGASQHLMLFLVKAPRVNEVDKHGDLRSDRVPVIGDESLWLDAHVVDV
jgi:hypothetical protein